MDVVNGQLGDFPKWFIEVGSHLELGKNGIHGFGLGSKKKLGKYIVWCGVHTRTHKTIIVCHISLAMPSALFHSVFQCFFTHHFLLSQSWEKQNTFYVKCVCWGFSPNNISIVSLSLSLSLSRNIHMSICILHTPLLPKICNKPDHLANILVTELSLHCKPLETVQTHKRAAPQFQWGPSYHFISSRPVGGGIHSKHILVSLSLSNRCLNPPPCIATIVGRFQISWFLTQVPPLKPSLQDMFLRYLRIQLNPCAVLSSASICVYV